MFIFVGCHVFELYVFNHVTEGDCLCLVDGLQQSLQANTDVVLTVCTNYEFFVFLRLFSCWHVIDFLLID
jgi:hypothetical protein